MLGGRGFRCRGGVCILGKSGGAFESFQGLNYEPMDLPMKVVACFQDFEICSMIVPIYQNLGSCYSLVRITIMTKSQLPTVTLRHCLLVLLLSSVLAYISPFNLHTHCSSTITYFRFSLFPRPHSLHD